MKVKNNWSVIVGIVSILLLAGLMVPVVGHLKKNNIAKVNALKKQGAREYKATDYVSAFNTYRRLSDSLDIQDEAVGINYANSAYLSSELLQRATQEQEAMGRGSSPDSTVLIIGMQSREKYSLLTAANDPKIASIASNQLGYASLKGSDVFAAPNADSLLFIALDHFKNALGKDPANDSARHNYELIKMIIAFPETILAEAKALIAEKRYKEAASVLERGMRRDPRLRQQKEFMERLRTVIEIDSLEGKGI